MKKYVVAYVSFFDNALTQEVIEANSSMEAMWSKLVNEDWDMSDTSFENEEELKQYAYNGDCLVSAYEVQ